MATPPRVTNVELSTTMRRIGNRREKVQDTDLEWMPNPDQCHPHEMLTFLRAHTRVPRWVQQADAADALRLCAWLWWEQRREELAWLKRGRALGLFLAQLGAPFGVGKQGVVERIDRHEALLRLDRPNEKITRDQRRAEREQATRRDVEQAWVDAHANDLSELVNALAAEADRFELADEDREWLDEAVRDARDGAWSPGSMTMLGMAVDEVRTAPPVVELDSTRPHKVHHLLARLDELRAEFAGLR